MNRVLVHENFRFLSETVLLHENFHLQIREPQTIRDVQPTIEPNAIHCAE